MLDLTNTSMIVRAATIATPSAPPEEVSKQQQAICATTLAALRSARAASEGLLNVQGGEKGKPHPMTLGIDRLIAHCEEGLAQYARILKGNSLNDLPF